MLNLFMHHFVVTIVDIGVSIDIATEKTLRVWCDIGLVQSHFADGLEVVTAIHTPPLQDADVNGIGGAEEGTAHTHQAVMAEPYGSGFVLADVVHRALPDAQATATALFHICFVEK